MNPGKIGKFWMIDQQHKEHFLTLDKKKIEVTSYIMGDLLGR